MAKSGRVHRESGRSLRLREIGRLRRQLIAFGFPRLQMLLLVMLTAAAGFGASMWLLHLGVVSMATRYAAATSISYGVFILLLWFWLRTRGDHLDQMDLGNIDSSSHGGHYEGHGGQFGGGGASESFGDAADTAPDVSGALDAEEFAIPILLILAVAGAALSSLWVVYSAPTLFAELLVDGVLASGLYHRLRRMDSRHWLESAVRRTAWPFALTLAVMIIAGQAMHWYAPEAVSIGEVLRHAAT